MSSHPNEICLVVKKMPRHNDDEIYTKRLADGPHNPQRLRARGALEKKKLQTQENQTILLKQEGYAEGSSVRMSRYSMILFACLSIREEDEEVDSVVSMLS